VTSTAQLVLPEEDDAKVDGNSGIRTQTLIDKLSEATILHLACHGLQDPNNPLKSGFVMRDDMLTIERLMALPLPRAFMAFLSACETAKGDKVSSHRLWIGNHELIDCL
jgi:CHAT domain-containing protein